MNGRVKSEAARTSFFTELKFCAGNTCVERARSESEGLETRWCAARNGVLLFNR